MICSNFSDIFDEEWFISSLANDVKIIKKLPKKLLKATRTVKQFKSWSGMDYYKNEIAAIWNHYKVCRLVEILLIYKFLCYYYLFTLMSNILCNCVTTDNL